MSFPPRVKDALVVFAENETAIVTRLLFNTSAQMAPMLQMKAFINASTEIKQLFAAWIGIV